MEKKYLRYAKRKIKKEMLTKSLLHNFKANKLFDSLQEVYIRSAELFVENSNASKELKYHLNQILPCIAFYEALIKKYNDQDEAQKYFDLWAYDELYKMAKIIKRIAKLGLYKKIPKLFDYFIDKLFGEKAGFKSEKPENEKVFSRNILVCPYNETCKKYGHPELTKYFCKSDDITYSSIHPNLVWSRTKTLGTDGDCCNFRLQLKKKKTE